MRLLLIVFCDIVVYALDSDIVSHSLYTETWTNDGAPQPPLFIFLTYNVIGLGGGGGAV